MAERTGAGRRVITWVGWGVASAVAYLIALPLLAGGLALLPIAVVAFEDGEIEAAIAVASGILVLLLLGGGLNLPALALMLAGVPLGALLRRASSPTTTGAPSLVLAILALTGLALLPAQYGGILSSIPASESRVLVRLLAANGLHGTIHELMSTLLPAFGPVYAGVITLEAYFATRAVLRLRSRTLPEILPFWLWVAPAWLPPLYLVAMAVQLSTNILGGSVQVSTDAWFVSIWAGIPLLIIGLAVVDHWLIRARLPQPARGIILVLAALVPLATQMLTWLGVLDGVFDIRRFRHQQG